MSDEFKPAQVVGGSREGIPAEQTSPPKLSESEQRALHYIAIAEEVATGFAHLAALVPAALPLGNFARNIRARVDAIYKLLPSGQDKPAG